MTIVDLESAFSGKPHGPDIRDTIEAPRVRVCADRTVDVEARIPVDVRVALEARGHMIRVLPEYSWVVGGGQGVTRNPATGTLAGGADPRRDGYAMGW